MSIVVYSSSYTAVKGKGLKGYLSSVCVALQNWRRRNRERRQLAMMNAYQLKDIGLTLTAARREINKPGWRD